MMGFTSKRGGGHGEAVMSNPTKNDSYYEFLRENELIQKEFIFPEKKKTRIGRTQASVDFFQTGQTSHPPQQAILKLPKENL
jgi:hypothetical protein